MAFVPYHTSVVLLICPWFYYGIYPVKNFLLPSICGIKKLYFVVNPNLFQSLKTWTTRSGHTIIQLLSGRSNVFLVTNGEKYIMVDTSPRRQWGKLVRGLKKLNIRCVDYLVITHAHYDHAENAFRLKTRYKAQVIAQKIEAEDLRSGGNWQVDGTNAFTRCLIKMLNKLATRKMSFESCPTDLMVDEKMDLTGMGFNAYVLHTPGHTPGSISLIVDDEIALVGDCMFGVFKGSAFPPFALDSRLVIESWGKLLNTGCRLFLPSHGTADSRVLVQRDYDKRKQSL
jgi:hydroxyacylglutathione hydrolase